MAGGGGTVCRAGAQMGCPTLWLIQVAVRDTHTHTIRGNPPRLHRYDRLQHSLNQRPKGMQDAAAACTPLLGWLHSSNGELTAQTRAADTPFRSSPAPPVVA